MKLEMIHKVLIDKQSINSTALDFGLPSQGLLSSWIKKYKDNNYVIVEKHATTNAREQHQYEISELKANFDYCSLIKSTKSTMKYLLKSKNELIIITYLDHYIEVKSPKRK